MRKLFLSAAVALCAATGAQAASFVTNGGFDFKDFKGNSEFGASYMGGGNHVSGWDSLSTKAYNILFSASNASSPSGNAANRFNSSAEYLWSSAASTLAGPDFAAGGNFVMLDGDSNYRGELTQMINNLVVGQAYQLTFQWAAAQLASRTGDTTEQIQYSLGSDTRLTNIIANPSQGFSGWNTVSATFTATSNSALLSFLSLGTPNGLPPVALLDSVSLTDVPEPGTWLMMMAGFGLLGGALRRRSRPAFA